MYKEIEGTNFPNRGNYFTCMKTSIHFGKYYCCQLIIIRSISVREGRMPILEWGKDCMDTQIFGQAPAFTWRLTFENEGNPLLNGNRNRHPC